MPKLFGFKKVPVPGQPTLPIIGAPKRFYDFLEDPVGVVMRLRKYGDVAAVVKGSPAIVCVYGAERNREILNVPGMFQHDEDLFRGPEGSAMQKLRNALVCINGQMHKRHRKLMQPAFQKSALDGYAPGIVETTRQRLATWPVGETAKLDVLCRELALCVAVKSLYGLDVREGVPELGALAAEFVDVFSAPKIILAPINLPGMPFRRALHLCERITQEFTKLIEEKRRLGGEQRDAMALLMAARDDDGQPLSDAELIAEAMVLFIAGHETTAMTLTWTLFLLERHPEVLESVLSELDEVLGSREPTPEDGAKLVILDRVIKESMRLLAPVPVLFLRVCAESTQVGKFTLPKGANVLVSPLATHHDPNVYPEPRRFKPERWAGNSPPAYAYLPFGAGPRTCVGLMFAERSLRLMLPMILQRYRISIPEDTKIDRLTRANIMMVRDGMPVKIEPFDRTRREPNPIRGDIHELVDFS